MSDGKICCPDRHMDDVLLLDRGINMMRALFSDNRNFGEYAAVADRFIWKADGDQTNGLDIMDGDERYKGSIQRPTVFIMVSDVQVDSQGVINDEAHYTEDGATRHYIFWETASMTFRAVSTQAGEVRLITRLILNYLLGFKDVLRETTSGQVVDARPQGKTRPTKSKDQGNTDNQWFADVQVQVRWQTSSTMYRVSPVLAELQYQPTPILPG